MKFALQLYTTMANKHMYMLPYHMYVHTHVAVITTDLTAHSPEVCFGLESKLLSFVFAHQQAS